MNDDQVRQDWVGTAVAQAGEGLQREVIRRGFGDNLARSVPPMGVRQYDEAAREIGVAVIDTRQTSGGFRQILQRHVPTTREAVNRPQPRAGRGRRPRRLRRPGGVPLSPRRGNGPAAADRGGRWQGAGSTGDGLRPLVLPAAAGRLRRRRCRRRCWRQHRVQRDDGEPLKAVDAIATWSERDVLTLGIDTPWLWADPLGEEEPVDLRARGRPPPQRPPRPRLPPGGQALAGRAARVMLLEGEHVRRQFARLFDPAPAPPGHGGEREVR